MRETNFRYLIKEKGYDWYLQAGTTASYSSDIGTAIHSELPPHISEEGDYETEVIRSDDPKFKEILEYELYGDSHVNGLEKSIQHDEQNLRRKKKNKDLIKEHLREIESSNGSRE